MQKQPVETAAETLARLRSASADVEWAQQLARPPETGIRQPWLRGCLFVGLAWVLFGMYYSPDAGLVWLGAWIVVVVTLPYWLAKIRVRRIRKAAECWRLDSGRRELRQWHEGALIRRIGIKDGDKLLIHGTVGNGKGRLERNFYLKYHRPYPAPEICLMVFAFGGNEDKQAFREAAQHLAALMKIPLEDYLD